METREKRGREEAAEPRRKPRRKRNTQGAGEAAEGERAEAEAWGGRKGHATKSQVVRRRGRIGESEVQPSLSGVMLLPRLRLLLDCLVQESAPEPTPLSIERSVRDVDWSATSFVRWYDGFLDALEPGVDIHLFPGHGDPDIRGLRLELDRVARHARERLESMRASYAGGDEQALFDTFVLSTCASLRWDCLRLLRNHSPTCRPSSDAFAKSSTRIPRR